LERLLGINRYRCSESIGARTAKACVAFALDALIALGENQEKAARKLLGEFPDVKNLAGSKSRRAATWEKTLLEWRKTLSAPSRAKNQLAAEIFTAGRDLIDAFIKTGRRTDLEKRALGRAEFAARVGVFVGRSNPL
jgi:hypothetical protein